MRTSSAKAKGRRACQDLVGALFGAFPELGFGDLRVTSSGATGEDIQMSPLAETLIPFGFEVKNQESMGIWTAIEQAKGHVKKSQKFWAVAFKRNNSSMYVCLELSLFVKLLRGAYVNAKNTSGDLQHKSWLGTPKATPTVSALEEEI